MKRQFKKISIPQLILEFISVVFAVLLALGLNTYKESKTLEKEAIKLQHSILKECRNNQRKIDSVLIKNQYYYDYLDSLVNLEPDDVTGFYFEYDYELLTSSAWEIAMNNPAVNELDQDFLTSAADIYQAQAFYLDFSKSVFENIGIFVSRMDELKEANLALSMYYSIGVMNSSAMSLQEDYKEFFTTFE